MSDISTIDLIQVVFWFLAGAISFYFSIGSSRVWTSISTGFFLIFISQLYLLIPALRDYQQLNALNYIIGTISIVVMTHGFQEYYVFSRTLETGGSKLYVYLGTLGAVAASAVFVFINPPPQDWVLRNIKMIENANWVFLSVINLDMLRKIYLQVKGSTIAKGFLAFMFVFACIFLWKGSELYLQVYAMDEDWNIFMRNLDPEFAPAFLTRVAFSQLVSQIGGLLAGFSVGGTFIYLYRLLK